MSKYIDNTKTVLYIWNDKSNLMKINKETYDIGVRTTRTLSYITLLLLVLIHGDRTS